jgi:hypothetical protein
MAEATREGRRQLRTFWHPYTDDAPEAMIEMTDCDPVAFLRRRGFAPNLSEAGLFRRAYEEKRPFNNPKLGCLRHDRNPRILTPLSGCAFVFLGNQAGSTKHGQII